MITKERIEAALIELSKLDYDGDPVDEDDRIDLERHPDEIPTDKAVSGLTFKHEESFGGEGRGEDCHYVYSVTSDVADEEKVYIKFDGYYESHNGSEYDNGFYICVPFMKEVRDWRKVK